MGFNTRLHLRFNNIKIKNQLYVVYFIAVFIPVLIIGSYLVINTKNIIQRQHIEQIKSDNLRVRNIMVDLTTSVSNIGDNFFEDDKLQDILSKEYTSNQEVYEAYRVYINFKKYIGYKTEVGRMELYATNEMLEDYGNFIHVTDEIKNLDWYKSAVSKPTPSWRVIKKKNNIGIYIYELCYIRRIPVLKTGEYAILSITINQNHLKSRINNNSLLTEIVVDDEPVFYSSLTERIGKKVFLDIDYDKSYYSFSGQSEYNGKNSLTEVSTLVPIGTIDKFYITTIDEEALPYVAKIVRVSIIIVLFSIIFPLFMILVYAKAFNKRITTLRLAMHKVSTGNYDITEYLLGEDELMDLFTDLQTMIESIKSMDKQLYSARIKEEKFNNHQLRMQYELLSSQINPHYLYNTLETIRMMAFNVDDREVATAIKLLGKSMRHVLESSLKTVTLESELEYVNIYLKIQHLRFAEKISFNIMVDEDINKKGYYILPLLLQPIVENAVNHGIEEQMHKGHVDIRVETKDEYLIIKVLDNGKGIERPELEELNRSMKNKEHHSSESIGLYNIYNRIQLFYGKKYGVSIESAPDLGTKVSVYLPIYSPKETRLDESFYRMD